MLNIEDTSREPSSSTRRQLRTFSTSDKISKYNKKLVTLIAICHLVCGISCLVARIENYVRVVNTFKTNEVTFIVVLSFYISGFCTLHSAIKSNLFWIICSMVCNINSFIGGTVMIENTWLDIDRMFVIRVRHMIYFDDSLHNCIIFLLLFSFAEIITSAVGFIVCVRSLCCGNILVAEATETK